MAVAGRQPGSLSLQVLGFGTGHKTTMPRKASDAEINLSFPGTQFVYDPPLLIHHVFQSSNNAYQPPHRSRKMEHKLQESEFYVQPQFEPFGRTLVAD